MEPPFVPNTRDVPYSPTDLTHLPAAYITERFNSITFQPEYQGFQVEELRLADYRQNPPKWIYKAASHKPDSMRQDNDFFRRESFGDLFTGETYAVKVGKGSLQKIYHVHETALRKCAPFAAAIEPGRWLASHTRQLDMSEEDPDIFVNLLEYLYTGEFAPRFRIWDDRKTLNTLVSQRQDAAYELTRLYCLADQYCLDSIKPLIIEKLELCEVKPDTFLQIAALAYDVLPEHDSHCLFKRWARVYMKANKSKLSECREMQAVVEKGGHLAWDIFRQSFIIRVTG